MKRRELCSLKNGITESIYSGETGSLGVHFLSTIGMDTFPGF